MEKWKPEKSGYTELSYHSKEPILSAKELIDVYNLSLDKKPSYRSSNSTSKCTVADTGGKLNYPSGTWLETNRTETRLRSLFQQVSIPKVAQKGQLSEAIWDDSLMKAKVTKTCGKHWNVMGHIHENSLYIYMEEALFLLECNSLELIHDNIAMSLQQAFQLLTSKKSDCSLQNYLTYSKLIRLGYKVVRHNKLTISSNMQFNKDNYKKFENIRETNSAVTQEDMKPGNKKEPQNHLILSDVTDPSICGLYKGTSKVKRSRKNSDNKDSKTLQGWDERSNQNDKLNESNQVCKDLNDTLIQMVLDNIAKNHNRIEQNHQSNTKHENNQRMHINQDLETIICHNAIVKSTSNDCKINKASTNEKEVVVLSDSEVASMDSLSMLPNCYNRNKVTLTVPPLDLLPNRAWPKKKVYIIDILRPHLNVNVATMDCSGNESYLKGTSLAVLDNDVEIINKLPTKTDESPENDEKHTTDSLPAFSSDPIISKNLYTKTIATISAQPIRNRKKADNEEAVDGHELINAHECSFRTNHKPKSYNNCEISDLVYTTMIEEPQAPQSRGYYPEINCLFDNRQMCSTKRKRTSKEKTGDDSDHSRKILRHAEKINLDSHPNERLPASNPNQCLPSDKCTLNSSVKQYKEPQDNNAVRTQNRYTPSNSHNKQLAMQGLLKNDNYGVNDSRKSKVISN